MIIKIIGSYSFILGLLFVIILKNSYLLEKNKYTEDGKYLAVITENGLWIKDEINNQINIINANKLEGEFLVNVVISQFDKDFKIIRTIQSKKVNSTTVNWIVLKPVISKNNTLTNEEQIEFY